MSAWFSQLQKLMWCHRFWFLKEVQLWKRQNLNNGVVVHYFFQQGCYQILLISPKISGERVLESIKIECLTHNRYSRNITFVCYFPLYPMLFKLKHPNKEWNSLRNRNPVFFYSHFSRLRRTFSLFLKCLVIVFSILKEIS